MYLLIELFNIGVPVVRTNGRAYCHVITKFSQMGRLRYFLTRVLRYNGVEALRGLRHIPSKS